MPGHVDPAAAPERSPQDLEVAVGPIVGGRRGRGTWLALAGLALVIVSLIVASQLFPAMPPPTAGVSPSPTGRAAPPTSAVSPSVVLTAAELRDRLADGSLDGAIVLVNGSMERRVYPCPSPGGSGTATCWSLALSGLDDVQIGVEAAVAAQVADDVPGGRLLFLAGWGTLVYLGRAEGPIERPVSVTQLLASAASTGQSAPDALASVSGWLAVEGVHSCPSTAAEDPTPCPAPGPWLTDDMPHANGVLVSEQGVAVRLEAGARLPIDASIAAGPFLLRSVGAPGRGAAWHVVARLDLAAVVRVTLP
jgi:hypothetical protein